MNLATHKGKTTYQCDDCGGEFETNRSQEEAEREAIENFGRGSDDPGMAVVCDQCYRDIMARLGKPVT